MSRKTQKKNRKKNRRRSTPMATEADRYDLYLKSVQAPDVDAKFLARVYRSTVGRPAKRLREDFCGTFAICCAWAKGGREREAWGVDLDPEPLEWGRDHNLDALSAKKQDRIHIVQGDVRTAKTPPVDIVAAQNFSYCCFMERSELARYFKNAYRALDKEGVFVVDLFGGYESIEDEREEVTEYEDFEYVWDQDCYDPIHARGTYKIHFRFPDKSEMKDAFVYEWRLWTIPEVREVMQEVGFSRADVYWEGTDEDTGEGTGRYAKATQGECDPAWICYIVGVKSA